MADFGSVHKSHLTGVAEAGHHGMEGILTKGQQGQLMAQQSQGQVRQDAAAELVGH